MQDAHSASTTDEEHKLILASRVLKTRVLNKAGEHIGDIKDLSIDRVTGETKYAIMSFGGFLGIGQRFHPLPWQMLDFDPQQDGYVVSLDKAALADAPHYDADELANLGGARHQFYSDQISGYYGVMAFDPLGAVVLPPHELGRPERARQEGPD
jgi:hypothetical protein